MQTCASRKVQFVLFSIFGQNEIQQFLIRNYCYLKKIFFFIYGKLISIFLFTAVQKKNRFLFLTIFLADQQQQLI